MKQMGPILNSQWSVLIDSHFEMFQAQDMTSLCFNFRVDSFGSGG